MVNIPGVQNNLPGVYSTVETQSRGVSVPGGIRVASIMGEGSTSEVLVAAALGNGQDGLNSTYTSTSGADGRHFKTSFANLVSNRCKLFRNGLPLVGLESIIDDNSFSYKYDYRIDIETGEIELQRAHLVDQGGLNYRKSTTNVGDGYLSSLTLEDVNAPSETWMIKCISVQRNGSNQPIAGTAKFIAVGSVSGNKLDANGNPVVWVANGQTVTNSILQFAIYESTPVFREGDSIVIQVASGVLIRNDSLSATYIPMQNLNDPEFLESMTDVQAKHGQPSSDNSLSIGCQLAFANAAPGVMTVQTAPSVARRTSYEMDPVGINALSDDVDEFILPFPTGVAPDLDSEIHIFVTNKTTNVETQLIPNKYPFYTLGTSGQPTVSDFIFDDVSPPGGNSFSYTVISQVEAFASGFDGYIVNAPGQTMVGVFGSGNSFDATYTGKILKTMDGTNVANNNYYLVTGVSGGQLQIELSDDEGNLLSEFPDFDNETSISFQVINPVTGLPVAQATDGYVNRIIGTGTGTFGSNVMTGVDFGSISNLNNMKLKINGTDTNNGLYNISAYDSLNNTVIITKTLVLENGLRFEVLDLNEESQYLVLNHNIVPNGNTVRVTIVDQKDASFYDAGWLSALESLESQEIDVLVPLPKSTISVIFQNCLAHCKTMSNPDNRKERVLFIGAISGLTPDNLTGAKLAAVEQLGNYEGIPNNDIPNLLPGELVDIANYSVPAAFGSGNEAFRCVYFYPDQIVVPVGNDNLLLDGFYAAAAAAGWASGTSNIAMPLTNKVLAGFTINRSKQLSNTVLGRLAKAGVTTLQPVQGGGRAVWGITTTQSGYVEEQEISIVFIRDRIAKTMRGGFTGYIGLPEDQYMTATLSARAQSLLTACIAQRWITAFDSLRVERDSVDPTQWNIMVKVQPTYPVNAIWIRVSVGLI